MHDQLDDFVTLTLDRFKKKNWVDISLDLQEYIFASRAFKKNKSPEAGGVRLNWKVQVTNTGTFKDSELYGVDTTGVKDLMKTATQEWSKQTVNFKYDIDEDVFQSDAETIIKELGVRNHSMYNDFFEGMEERMWTSPASSTESPRRPSGIPFWLQQSTTAAFGFNGGNPASGFADGVAGINSDTYPNWSNGTFTYVTVSDDDLLDKWAEACEKCYFKAPHSFNQLDKGMSNWEFYTVYSVYNSLQKLLRASNDNLGNDLGRFRGAVVFKGNLVSWVPALTNSTSAAVDANNPIYGIDWSTVEYCFQKNRNMIRHKPIESPGQHTVREVHMDNWGNFKCTNRRRNFVGRAA
jgi:hypothetical protein